MERAIKGGIVAVLIIGIVVAVVSRTRTRAALAPERGGLAIPVVIRGEGSLPKLVVFGSGSCLPCQLMKPVLEELKKDYDGRLDVVQVSVDEFPEAVRQFRLRTVPTEIFLRADGRELYRREGFMAKEEIVARWKDVGVTLESGTRNEKK